MNLIDVVKLIPESNEFIVEEYANPNNPDSMIYAWLIRPYNTRDRDNLICVYNNEVIGLRNGCYSSCENGNLYALTVEIQL